MNSLSCSAACPKQYGFSLLELSIFIVLLGLGSIAFWQLSSLADNQELSERHQTLLHRADQALTGYILSQQRLPCPAENTTSGIEVCANGHAAGYLPFKTLGLPDADAGLIRYSVLRRPINNIYDADLTQLKPRFHITHFDPGINEVSTGVSPSPSPKSKPSAWESGVYMRDFCSALSAASALPLNLKFAYSNMGKERINHEYNVAYGLAIRKERHQTAGPEPFPPSLAFDAPTDNLLSTQKEAVLAVSPQSLAARLACAPLAAAVRGYANAQVTSAIHTRTLPDYLYQLDISLTKAKASHFSSQAALAKASEAYVGALAALMLTTAEGLESSATGKGSVLPSEIKQVLKLYAKTGHPLVLAALYVDNARYSLRQVQENHDRVLGILLPKANNLKLDIDQRFRRTMNAGIYLPSSTP